MSSMNIFENILQNNESDNEIKYAANGKKLYVQTDYFGNIYLKYEKDYYLVLMGMDYESGLELVQIKNPDTLRKNLEDLSTIKKNIKSGTIKSDYTTLRGKASEAINNMTDEEIDEYATNNEFMNYDPEFTERKFFWVQYDNVDETLEGEEDEYYYLNNVIEENEMNNTAGMVYSDLQLLTPGTFDTILIDGDMNSKNVVSNTERIDGSCTCRLTIYTAGYFRANFFDKSKYSRLCIDSVSNSLSTKLMK
jgi:hypothetical protein